MLEELSKIDTATVGELREIRQRQTTLDERLAKLEERQDQVSPAVYARVGDDYRRQQGELREQARPLETTVRREAARLDDILEEAKRRVSATELDQEEVLLRHELGELDDGSFAERRDELDERLIAERQAFEEAGQLHRMVLDVLGPAAEESNEDEPAAAGDSAPEESAPEAAIDDPIANADDLAASAEDPSSRADEAENDAGAASSDDAPAAREEEADDEEADDDEDGEADKSAAEPGDDSETDLASAEADGAAEADSSSDAPASDAEPAGNPPAAPTSTAGPMDVGATVRQRDPLFPPPPPGGQTPGEPAAARLPNLDTAPTTEMAAEPLEPPTSLLQPPGDAEPEVGATRVGALATLIMVSDRGEEKRFALGVGVQTIGRTIDNDICVPGLTVSRRHAKIEFTNAGFRIVDTGSENGLWFAGDRIEDRLLEDGDRIEVGSAEKALIFQRNPAAAG
ncbi:MAG: FHA domain-containing protein [Acidobacteriota bacterium]